MPRYPMAGANTTPTYTPPVTVEWLTLENAAAYVGLSTDTIRRRIREGQLPAYRSGRSRNSRVLVKRADLENMLKPIPTVGRLA